MTLLDELAKEYVELLLTKHQHHDIWDVYWYADTPFYKRTDIYVNRNRPAYPYKPAPCMPKMSLEQILEKTNVLYQKLISNDEFENGNDEIRNQYLIEHVRSMITRIHFLMEKQMSYDEYTYGNMRFSSILLVEVQPHAYRKPEWLLHHASGWQSSWHS